MDDDTTTTTPETIVKELFEYGERKYDNLAEGVEVQEQRAVMYENSNQIANVDSSNAGFAKFDAEHLTMAILLEALSQLKPDTAHPRQSRIVTEMLQRLPWAVLLVIRWHFRRRASGAGAEEVQSWRELLLARLPKIRFPQRFKNFRGVVLMHQLSKGYIGCLVLIGQSMLVVNLPLLPFNELVNVYGLSTDLVVGGTRHILTKGYEWYGRQAA